MTGTAARTRRAGARGVPAEAWWATGAVVVLALTTWAVWDQRVPAWEREAFAAVNERSVLPYAVAWSVMQLGNVLAVPVSALAATLARRPRLGLALLVGGVAAYVLAKLVKATVARPRPPQLLEEVVVRGPLVADHGFVSGHTAVATVLVVLLLPHVGPALRAVLLALALLVAVLRVAVGAHLPLDVAGGAALGVAVAVAVHLALDRRGTGG